MEAIVNDAKPAPVSVQAKRPMNAYMLFCAEYRDDLMKNDPELTHRTVMARLGELWKEMPDTAKQPYRERARHLQDEFKQENPVYKYKSRKSKVREAQSTLPLPPGITVAEASYLMFVGMQVLMNGGQKLPPSLSSLAGKLAQLKALSEALAEEVKKKDELFELGISPFALDPHKKE